MVFDHQSTLDLLMRAATAAGEAAMPFFRMGSETSAGVTMKSGNSPVTEADFAANATLLDILMSAHPDYGWISEEDEDSVLRLGKKHVFVADPIDGTRAFMAGKPEWCVSIGLIENSRPVAGVIHLPALGLTYRAARGAGAFLSDSRLAASTRLSASTKVNLETCRYAGPKSTYDALQKHVGDSLVFAPRVPSLAYRLVMATSGEVDIAVASTGSHDWDIAAADIILAEAGAMLADQEGQSLLYNRPDLSRGMLMAGPVSLVEAAKDSLGLHHGLPAARTL